jgi:nucleoside-diphosphate-sugar epimerase
MTTQTSTPASRTVLVLGAGGRFGRAAVAAFSDAGWHVRAFVRPNRPAPSASGVDAIEGDAFDATPVIEAARGAEIIVHALNPPYPRWRQDLPRHTESVLAAARATGATVMIPGNVYNYGSDMPAILSEETPHHPSTRKGALREEMEQSFRRAAGDGVHTVILRAGDFIEATKTGNWFDTYVTAKIERGVAVYPGPLNRVHAWAYLPDMARALVALAERDDPVAGFESFNFGGYNVTGAALIAALETHATRTLKVRGMPWFAMHLMAPIAPLIREVLEMRYLWTVPHAVDGSALLEALPAFHPTPLAEALAKTLPALKTGSTHTGSRELVSVS